MKMGKQMIVVAADKIANVPARMTDEQLRAVSPDLYQLVMKQPALMTGRILPDNDDRIEFKQDARFHVDEGDGDIHSAVVAAVFFQPKEDVEANEDLSVLEWVPSHFEIVD